MTSADMSPASSVDIKLEVVTVPVSDVDRAKRFYQGLGWRLDADIAVGDAFRVVQLDAAPLALLGRLREGRHHGRAWFGPAPDPGGLRHRRGAREPRCRRGAEISEVFHLAGGRVPGPDPQGRSYQTYASFTDPDGNGWLLQEIKTRLPGREWEESTANVAARADLLRETAEHHDHYEKTHAPHNWWDWYSAYFGAREHGKTPDEAVAAANRYMDEVLHIAAL